MSKRCIITVTAPLAGLLLLGGIFTAHAAPGAVSPGDRADAIDRRVLAGDLDALSDFATLPLNVVAPHLLGLNSSHRNHHLSPAELARDRAIEKTLRQLKGIIPYLRKDAAVQTAKGAWVPSGDFELLATIDTEDAASVLAPYLFDRRESADASRDNEPPAICQDAMAKLQSMNLPDAPAGKAAQGEWSAALIAWQKWALRQGYVPAGWKSLIGAPSWLLRQEKEWKS
ncbi:MAG TPA: hypothetical protein VG733_11720 [Chthoniobacteraceae bacterium]|nr:hypothetical protein [Chthoniobacteraceae bacterium]